MLFSSGFKIRMDDLHIILNVINRLNKQLLQHAKIPLDNVHFFILLLLSQHDLFLELSPIFKHLLVDGFSALFHGLLTIVDLVSNLIFHLSIPFSDLNFHFLLVLFEGIIFSFDDCFYFLGLFNYMFLDYFSLISHEYLDVRNHTFPITISVGHILRINDQRVEVCGLFEMASDDKAFSVDFTSMLVSVQDLLSHNLLVTLGDDSDKEIQKNDQSQDDVEEPECPD